MIFESHAHYDDEAFNEDRDELLRSMPQNDIGYIINVGSSLETTKTTVEFTSKYPYIYGAAGVEKKK